MRSKLGYMEQYQTTLSSLRQDSCVTVAAEYSHGNFGQVSLSKDVLYAALSSLIKEHAALGIRILQKSLNKSSFVKLETIDLDKVVEYVDGQDVVHVMEQCLGEQFDLSLVSPLWRLIVIDRRIVVFIYHHAVGDGMSGVAFHRCLRKALNSRSGDEVTSTVSVPSLELVPPIEANVDISPPISVVVREVLALFYPTAWKRHAKSWTGAPVGKKPTAALQLKAIKFSSLELAQLRAACHSHNVTITGVLYSAQVAAISGLIQPSKYKSLSVHIPVSLRHLTHASPEAICVHMTDFLAYPRLNSQFSWSLASDMTAELKKQKFTSKERIGLMKYLFGDYTGYFTSHLGKKRETASCLTNIGVFPALEQTDSETWDVTDMWFAHCDAYAGSAIGISVVGLANGGLTVVLSSGVGVLKEGMLEAVRDRLAVIVRELL